MNTNKNYFLATLLLILSGYSAAYPAKAITFGSLGNARLAAHDYGIKLTRADRYDTRNNPFIFSEKIMGPVYIAGIILSLMRGAVVTSEHRFLNDTSTKAEASKAAIAFIRCLEEI